VSKVVDIQTVSIAIASAGVFAAAVYYVLQIRHQTRTRQTDLIMKLYSTYGSGEFQEARWNVMNREFKDFDDYTRKFGWKEETEVGIFFEGIGVLLKRKLVDISLVDDLFSTSIKNTWEKMKPFIEAARKKYDQPALLEWFEYLYNEMKKREQRQ
jgi:hypothetical protein